MIWNIAALTAVLSAAQATSEALGVTELGRRDTNTAMAKVKDQMAGPKTALDEKINSYVAKARAKFEANGRKHHVPARKLAGAGTGYFHITHYTDNSCGTPSVQAGNFFLQIETDYTVIRCVLFFI